MISVAPNDKDVFDAIILIVTEIKDGDYLLTGLEDLPPLITPAELARFMRTTTNSLAQDRYLGHGVPFIKAGRRVLYARDAVIEYLKRNTVKRTDDPRGISA